MREELDKVEQYSIDEAFFQVATDAEAVAWRVKQAVEREVGIPVSIGVARTKTQAKYANRLAKKRNGVYSLNEADWLAATPSIKLQEIWGVGGQLELQYKRQGLNTVADLLASDTSRVAKTFGVGGVNLQQELLGISVFPLGQKTEPQKSIMSSRSFRDTTTELAVLADAVAYHVRHAVADLRAMNMEAKTIVVSIRPSRFGDFMLRGGMKEAVLPGSSSDSLYLLKVAHDLLVKLYEPGVPYKKAGVLLANFVPLTAVQATLFPDETKPATRDLMAVIDAVNSQSGEESILLGSRLRSPDWQARAEVQSPAYTTRWSDLALVTAK